MGHKRNIMSGYFSTGTGNLFGKIQYTHMKLLRNRCPLYSKEEKLEVLIREVGMRKLLQNSNVTKTELHR